jgi:serine/threonine-protein phosphatase 6 regulatory ankyrin repeat subunit A/serine/threonine-protein phosphatase 6 regulatory ankyrin repeat subunit B
MPALGQKGDFKMVNIFDLLEKKEIESIKMLSPEMFLLKNIQGETPFMVAIRENFKEAIDFFMSLDEMPFLNFVNKKEYNALTYAIRSKNEDLAFKLIQKGINIHQKDNLKENTLFWAAMMGLEKLAIELVFLGVDVNGENLFGLTPLCAAALHNERELAKLLMDFGANKEHKDMYGMNAASWANFQQNYEICKFIIAYKPSLSICD